MTEQDQTMSEADRLGLGGNNPPPDLKLGEALLEELRDQNADLTKLRDDLIAAGGRTPATITDDATSANMSKFLVQIQKTVKACKDRFATTKAPWLSGSRAVDNYFAGVRNPLEELYTRENAKQTAFGKAKEAAARAEADRLAKEARDREDKARREAEAAEKETRRLQALAKKTKDDAEAQAAAATLLAASEAKAKEARQAQAQESVAVAAATKVATASAATLSRTRGEVSHMSLQTTWKFEVEDISKVPVKYLITNDKVINAEIAGEKGLREIPGLRIYPNHEARNRG